MKLKPNSLEFHELGDFLTFVDAYHLANSIQLKNELTFDNGETLLRAGSVITDSIIKRLIEKEDKFEHYFQVQLSGVFIEKINSILANAIFKRITTGHNPITNHLLSNTDRMVDYQGIIQNSLFRPAITMTLFYFYKEARDFFHYLTDMGALCLSIILQEEYNLKFINRYAFLAGLFKDIPFAGTKEWKRQNFNEATYIELAKAASFLGDKIELPYEVISAIEFPVLVIMEEAKSEYIDVDKLRENPFFENVVRDAPMEETEQSAQIIETLVEALKITKFVSEVHNRLMQEKNSDGKLLTMFKYNIEKGFFTNELAHKIVEKFKKYEELLDGIRTVAAIEKACPFQSAWAYPKPRSTQVLCQKRVTKCPLCIPGRDINIVQRLSPYGYLGVALEKGYYPKCKLEEKLVNKKPAN
ncbi:MAG: hypothetical protein AAF518_13365 [Spirochaetota bacterium]